MTQISSADFKTHSRRDVLAKASAIGAGVGASLFAPAIATAQAQMPLNGRMKMLEYMPAGDNFRLPDIAFFDPSGNRTTISRFQGRPVVLSMWRINCHVCQADMPELSRVKDSAGGQGVEFIPLSFAQDSVSQIQGFHARKNISNLPIYRMESSELFNTYAPPHPGAGARATPTTILFDRRGNARMAIVGVRTGLHLPEGQELLNWLKTA